MEFCELKSLSLKVEDVLKEFFSGYKIKVSVDHAESPNPLCFFEIDGAIFAQGSFWLNNEYHIEAMNTVSAQEIMNEHGEIKTVGQALQYVQGLCERANSK
jgi:hypothetical protein